uniref:Uncharacterized protein TCIL3000_11_13080 n=1 Tax=Trypanosoma congolense (strain IL3000) TaxID=1068625 RepID=G0V2D7_TRYCI|nr:unnamed protein product [Trypanosoma congolense IL3000]
MAAGTGKALTLTPLSTGLQVIHLHSKLVVGIRMHGSIAAPHPRIPSQLKYRPFLHYFGETLRRLRCDVTLFSPIAEFEHGRQLLSPKEFPCEYRVLHDPTAGASCSQNGVCGRKQQERASRGNFQDYLSEVAAELNTSPQRIIFIDAEINYRFSPVQTIVLEAFEPRRMRQRQPSSQNELCGDIATAREVSRRSRQHTAMLDAEFEWAQGQKRHHCHRNLPFSPEVCPEIPRPVSDGEVREAALAIRREDYTLVALAGLLVELAAADVSVADFLRVEPIVEKLRVPFHGSVNYLPIENCDDMEQWNWDAVEVREAEAMEEAAAVPEVEEREEHRGMFK